MSACALFDKKGNLIANAPHIPIHLGAMSETVKFCIQNYQNYFHAGTSLIHNDPYTGGTHLPDLTIITPYLDKIKKIKDSPWNSWNCGTAELLFSFHLQRFQTLRNPTF